MSRRNKEFRDSNTIRALSRQAKSATTSSDKVYFWVKAATLPSKDPSIKPQHKTIAYSWNEAAKNEENAKRKYDYLIKAANCYTSAKDYKSAAHMYSQAANIATDYADKYYCQTNAANCFSICKDYLATAILYDNAAKLAPTRNDEYNCWQNAGRFYFYSDDEKNAEFASKKAAEVRRTTKSDCPKDSNRQIHDLRNTQHTTKEYQQKSSGITQRHYSINSQSVTVNFTKNRTNKNSSRKRKRENSSTSSHRPHKRVQSETRVLMQFFHATNFRHDTLPKNSKKVVAQHLAIPKC